MRIVFVSLIPIALSIAGCGAVQSRIDYAPPSRAIAQNANVKVIKRSRDDVWSAAVPALGKQFFVINNIEKASGLMNVSYNGDPEKYIDCGRITSYVKNLRGERNYEFAGAKAHQT